MWLRNSWWREAAPPLTTGAEHSVSPPLDSSSWWVSVYMLGVYIYIYTTDCPLPYPPQGPVLGRWFRQLDKMVGSQQTLTGRTLAIIRRDCIQTLCLVGLKKMVIDQACFVPVFFGALLPILSLTQGVPLARIPQSLKQVNKSTTLTEKFLCISTALNTHVHTHAGVPQCSHGQLQGMVLSLL